MFFQAVDQPMQLLYSNTALIVGLVYTLLPFMILPLYASMEKLDHSLIEAARDLGANRVQVFFHVLIPQTIPGILSGVMLYLDLSPSTSKEILTGIAAFLTVILLSVNIGTCVVKINSPLTSS